MVLKGSMFFLFQYKNSYIIIVFKILLLICNQKVLRQLKGNSLTTVQSQRENKALYNILLGLSVIFDMVKN